MGTSLTCAHRNDSLAPRLTWTYLYVEKNNHLGSTLRGHGGDQRGTREGLGDQSGLGKDMEACIPKKRTNVLVGGMATICFNVFNPELLGLFWSKTSNRVLLPAAWLQVPRLALIQKPHDKSMWTVFFIMVVEGNYMELSWIITIFLVLSTARNLLPGLNCSKSTGQTWQ